MKFTQKLGIIGFLSGLVATISIILVGDTYGPPGSTAYRNYEIFNRGMAILILLEVCTLIAFFAQQWHAFARIGKILVIVVLGAWIGMAIGTAAEFWLFSDLPYGVDNMRNTAYSIFSISSLIVGLGLLALGVYILAKLELPRYIGIILTLYLPTDIGLFLANQSIFLASALFSIVIAGFILRSRTATVAPRNQAA